MERGKIINEIENYVRQENAKSGLAETNGYDMDGLDLWVNDGGEDLQVNEICWEDGKVGVNVGANDFFSLEELEDNELENIYDALTEE